MTGRKCGIFALAFAMVLIGRSECFNRTLDYGYNENCNDLCKNEKVRLGHVRARGPNDTIHYLWDFTRDPTIFIVVTSHTAKFNVDWSSYIARLPYSVNFTEKPIYGFGVVIEKLFEFNDFKDNARIDQYNNTNIVELNFKNFQWSNKNFTKRDNLVEFFVEANSYNDTKFNKIRSGNIKFLLQAFSNPHHSDIIPCMLHTENATQVDIVIDQLETSQGFTKSRFALQLLVVSENNPNTTLDFDVKQKIDDEFSPGIFEVVELIAPGVHEKSGYIQWKPVSYQFSDRHTINSTGTTTYPVKDAAVSDYFNKNNLLYLYYGEDMFNNLAQRVNISIGEEEDGFYKKTNYTTWTFIAGYGTPADEPFSFIVTLIIIIGLGIPVLAMTSAGIYVCVRRRRNNAEFTHR